MTSCDNGTAVSQGLLLSIAFTLGIDPVSFADPQDNAVRSCATEVEVEELLGLFRAIPCAQRRRRCLEFVLAVASSGDEGVQ